MLGRLSRDSVARLEVSRRRGLLAAALVVAAVALAPQCQPPPLGPPDPPPDPAPADEFPPIPIGEGGGGGAGEAAAGGGGLVSVLGDPTSGTWLAQGPGPTTGGQVRNLAPNDSVVGAVHTVVAHPSDPDILYVGSTNGGIWRTENATAASPSWTPLFDDFPALAIGAFEMDPADPDVLFAGNGAYSSFTNNQSGPLLGALLSTDGGTSWTLLDDPLLVGRTISGVAVRGNTLVVSARPSGGIYRSTDLGATPFTQISGSNGLPFGGVWDMVGDPTNPARLYAAVASNGIYKSEDTGLTWTPISNGDATLDSVIGSFSNNNTEMAVSPVTGRLFASVLQSGQVQYIGYTDDMGGTWIQMDLPMQRTTRVVLVASNTTPIQITSIAHTLQSANFPADRITIQGVLGNTAANGTWTITRVDADNFTLNGSAGNGAHVLGTGTWSIDSGLNPRFKPGGQGGVHHSILADASDADTVYIGGDRQDNPFPNQIGAIDFSGNLWRGDASVAPTGAVPSPQWEHMTDLLGIAAIPGGGTAGFTAGHADSREMVFDADGDLIEVNDGGVVRRTSPEDNTGDWTSLVGDLQVTECHDIAWDTNADIILCGAQDTGTPEQTSTGSTTWRSVSNADGGDVAVDVTSFPGFSIRYSSTQNLGGFRARVCDAANTCGAAVFPNLNITSGNPMPTSQFVTPVELNRNDPSRLLIGYADGVYESLDGGANIAQVPGSTGANRNAMVYGHADNIDLIYVGRGSNVWSRTTNGGNLAATSGPGAGPVVDVTVDPADENSVFAVTPTTVWESPDGGATWNDISGDLPPEVGNINTIEYIQNGADTDRVAIGSHAGVWLTPTNALGSWFEMGQSLPHAPVWDMDYDTGDDLLLAGTMGRGAWTLSSASTVNIPPVARCQDLTLEADANCEVGAILPSQVDDGSFDPDGGSLSFTLFPSNSLPLGETMVTLTVTDDEGAQSECEATVEVTVTPPGPIDVSGDTYVRKGDADDNEGASTFLRMGSFNYPFFLQFDPAQYNPNMNLHCVDITATVTLPVLEAQFSASHPRAVCLHAMQSDWVEGNGFHYDAPVESPGAGPGATYHCAIDADVSNDVQECTVAWDLDQQTPNPWTETPAACDDVVRDQVAPLVFDMTDAFTDLVDPVQGLTDDGFAGVKTTNEEANIRYGTREGGQGALLEIEIVDP